jgi:hypothetical protein
MKTFFRLLLVVAVLVFPEILMGQQNLVVNPPGPIPSLPTGEAAMKNYLATNTDVISVTLGTKGVTPRTYVSLANHRVITSEADLLQKTTEMQDTLISFAETNNPTYTYALMHWTVNKKNDTLLFFYKEFNLILSNGVWRIPPEALVITLTNKYKDFPMIIPGMVGAKFFTFNTNGVCMKTNDTVTQTSYVEGIPFFNSLKETLYVPNDIARGTNGYATLTVPSGVNTDYNLNTGQPIAFSLGLQQVPAGKKLSIASRPGQVIVQTSSDFQSWIDWTSCTATNGTAILIDSRSSSSLFYRLRYP